MSTAPQSPQQPGPQQPEPQVSASRDEVRVRRAPRYPVFIFGGIIVGIIVTFIAVATAPGKDDGTPFLQAFGYFVLYGIAIGALFGSLVAVLLDWIATRRARDAEGERIAVETPEPDEPIEGELE